jgi:hypothetical protein
MSRTRIIFAARRGLSDRLQAALLVLVVGLLFTWQPPAQANAGLKAIVLPQAVTRSTIVDNNEWQRMGVELEHLHSQATLETTLEQLAALLPELTPVWSEEGVARAQWITAESSYTLFLWATEQHGTEGLLSSLELGPSESVRQKNLPLHSAARAWLPSQAEQLFSFVDRSNGYPIAVASYTVPIMSSVLIQHIEAYAKRNGWLSLREALTFLRDTRRLTFLIHAARGNTTVLVYETPRDAL